MATATNCNTLLAGIAALNCIGAKNPGGVDGVVYIGSRSDLATVTIDGTSKDVTAITLKSGKKLYKFAGKKETHELKTAVKVQQPKNMYTQSVSLFLFPGTQIEVAAVEQLVNAERLFCAVVTLGGRIKFYGIDENPWISGDLDDERGLKCSAGDIIEGKEIVADNWSNIVLSGDFWCGPKLFKTSEVLATNIATLDALCV
jgi:hypothetical protein